MRDKIKLDFSRFLSCFKQTAVIFLLIVCFIHSPVFSQESITITTYYPSPYGVYNQLLTQTLGVGDNDGDTVLDDGDVPNPTTNPGNVWINGRVGIGTGTTNPGADLDIRNTASAQMRLNSGNNSLAGLWLAEDSAPRWGINNIGNNGDRLRIDSGTNNGIVNITQDGRIGIGTQPTAASKLFVNGQLSVRGLMYVGNTGDNSEMVLNAGGGRVAQIGMQDDGNQGFYIKTRNQYRVSVNWLSGNVAIGPTTVSVVHKLLVSGTAGLSTGTAWTFTSDRRWKDVQSKLKGSSLEKILALSPISYTWNDLHNSQFGENPGLKYGFIAQEVKEVIPEMTSRDEKGYYWYNPSGIEAILTAAIQEQQDIINGQRRDIDELKVRLDRLEKEQL